MTKIEFKNNSSPDLSAENLNKMQENIENAIEKSSIIPDKSSTYNLGSAGKQYKNGFFEGIVFDGESSIKIKWAQDSNNVWRPAFYVDNTFIGYIALV